MLEQVLNIIFVSVLTAGITSMILFLLLRWIFAGLAGSIGGLTSLGAKVAGEASGFSRGSRAVANKAAIDLLNSPKMGGIKFLASNLGFDIDSYIEEHGALETISGISQLCSLVGIDAQRLFTEGIDSVGKDLLKTKVSHGSGQVGGLGRIG